MQRLTWSLALVAFVLVPALTLTGCQSGGKSTEKLLSTTGQSGGKSTELPTSTDLPIPAMKFVKVPKGTFWMSKDEKNAQVQVEIEEDFEIAVYTVTQKQWQAVMGNNPSYFSRQGTGKGAVRNVSDEDLAHFPVELVSWNDVQEFLKKLNAREQGRGWLYRLPKDAEWEYACRGGATSKEECSFDFYLDQPTNDLSWNEANIVGSLRGGKAAEGDQLNRPTKVGSYRPNKLGLYDMHGNVWQWCFDLFDAGPDRVLRGGCWSRGAHKCRAGLRYRYAPTYRNSNLGFRLARVPSGGK
jgi:formylglycine-generating enzyme required for sulfatase activity